MNAHKEGYKMFKWLSNGKQIEKELNQKITLFGEEISVKVIYTKIKNTELN